VEIPRIRVKKGISDFKVKLSRRMNSVDDLFLLFILCHLGRGNTFRPLLGRTSCVWAGLAFPPKSRKVRGLFLEGFHSKKKKFRNVNFLEFFGITQ